MCKLFFIPLLTIVPLLTIPFTKGASAAVVTVCSDDGSECYQKKNVYTPPAPAAVVGSYGNPIIDDPSLGDHRFPVHAGLYCTYHVWHRGYLRPWETSPVIKPSCGE